MSRARRRPMNGTQSVIDEVDDDFLMPPNRRDLAAAIDASPVELPSGTRVGRYEIIQCIAHGGMGAVYRARRADAVYDKDHAITVIVQQILVKLFAP